MLNARERMAHIVRQVFHSFMLIHTSFSTQQRWIDARYLLVSLECTGSFTASCYQKSVISVRNSPFYTFQEKWKLFHLYSTFHSLPISDGWPRDFDFLSCIAVIYDLCCTYYNYYLVHRRPFGMIFLFQYIYIYYIYFKALSCFQTAYHI